MWNRNERPDIGVNSIQHIYLFQFPPSRETLAAQDGNSALRGRRLLQCFVGASFSAFSGDKGTVIEQKQSDRMGRRLLEVFSVRMCEAVYAQYGKLIYGFGLLGPSGCLASPANVVLFRRKAGDPPIVNKAGFIQLSGPMTGVQVNEEVALHSYIWTLFPEGCNDTECANTLWKADEETDKIKCKKVESFYGLLEVYFAVYNNAVEAHLKVVLVNWEVHDGVEVFGTVDSRSSIIPYVNARSKLFDRSIEDPVRVRVENDGAILPLSRSVTVLPLGSTLLVDVTISRLKNSRRDQPPIFENLSFDAAFTGTETKVASSDWGNVEVTVTWSG
ncbi:hypothetical protein LUZ61_017331 [Rhynchospora tenuis]|uniref:DUF6598 domain-containing protein n=1 Tax=Rhynchospora tenuis TaxID=198213 RepID=A0AAD5Z758_9POAL|nr:hypothetical protein LUZ61_017331 [Rhynchospora tenuis]